MATEKGASAHVMDFTNVKEGGARFNKKRYPEGDYLAKVVKVEDAEVKSGDNKGAPQWLFSIVLEDHPLARYPYYCQFESNQLWKIRNLLVAAGVNVPKKRVKVDPERIVGKLIAVSLQDTEYDGKEQSEIAAVFPPSDLTDTAKASDDDDEEEEDEDEEPTPPRRKAKKAPEPEEDDDEEEEEEEPAPRRAKKKRQPEPEPEEEDEDEEEEEEEPAPRRKPAKKAASRRAKVSADELEELDIEDI